MMVIKIYKTCLEVVATGVFLLLTFSANAQLSGTVRDFHTREPLAFAHITINDTQDGTLTDIDGRFLINESNVKTIAISYLGYETKRVTVVNQLEIEVLLIPSTEVLGELVVLEGENPAIPILKRAIRNKKSNNPEKLPYFSLKTYNKFTMSVNPGIEDTSESASFLRSSGLFIMESVSEKKYLRPGKYHEKVIANKVSGFRNPSFTTLANGLQPFSFYEDYISLIGVQFTNPLGNPGLRQYNYYLEDSLKSSFGKIYVLSFYPKKKNASQLVGFLHINESNWALENVIAESEDYSDTTAERTANAFKIQQKYEVVDGQWFPKQLNTNIRSRLSDGQVIEGVGRTYIRDVDLNRPVEKKEIGRIAVEFPQEANRMGIDFWQANRQVPLSLKEETTYSKIDSIGEAMNFDRFLKGFNALVTGQFKIGKIGLDLNRIANYNRYEGFRLGAGFHTNDDFSDFVQVGGYFGYGFNDKDFKYGGDALLKLTDKNDLSFFASHSREVIESGGVQFYKPAGSTPLASRNILIENMDIVQNTSAGFQFYWLKNVDTKIAVSASEVETTSGYTFFSERFSGSTFSLTDFDLQFRYAPKLQYVESFGQELPIYTGQPIFWLNLTKSSGVFSGDFDYTRVSFKMLKLGRFKKFGSTSFIVEAGQVFGDTPYPRLFNGKGTNFTDFGLETQDGFQTVRLNEFLSDRYAYLFTNIYLGKVVLNKKFSAPVFTLRHNMGWGTLENPERHQNFDFSTLERGIFESGLSIQNLITNNFSGYGLGVYYRYGPNDLGGGSDNLVFKFNVSLALN